MPRGFGLIQASWWVDLLVSNLLFSCSSSALAGAGDCFTAAYMVGLLEGRNTAGALKFAAAAASICVSRPGAMTSLPTRTELNVLMESLE